MHHHDGRSASECKQNLTKPGSLPRFGCRLAAGITADGPTSFKKPQKGAIVCSYPGSSGEYRLSIMSPSILLRSAPRLRVRKK